MIHSCETCGLVHDHVEVREADALAIARIEADRDIRIAQLQAGADKHVADTYAEADVESAKAESKAIQAAYADEESDEHVVEAINAVTAGLEMDAEPEPEPAPMPMIVNENENDDVTVPPKREESEAPKEPAPKKKGLSLW